MFSATKSFFTNEATGGGALSPSWSLDFSTGTPSGYTLTRASTGTYVDSSGYVASASTDIARLTHDSSGSRLGLLVEEQRTNLLLRSEDFGNATWLKIDGTVTTNSVAAPDNATTADSLIETTANNCHLFYQTLSLAQNVDHTLSVFLKKGGRDHVAVYLNAGSLASRRVMVDLTNGTVSDSGNASGFAPVSASESVQDFGNGWYRLRVTMKASNSSGTQTYEALIATSDRSTFTGTLQYGFGFPQYVGNTGIVGVYAWGAQFETASTATSYIPTTTASVTRSADLAHVLDSSITSWGDPGALVVHFYPPGQAGTLISTDDASTAQVGIEASTTTAARAFWSSGSTATGTIGSGVQKAVHYWNGSTSKFAINGGTVQSGTNNLTIGNTDFVTLGAEATESGGVPGTFSQYANCVIRKVEFYSGTLTDANLQTITT